MPKMTEQEKYARKAAMLKRALAAADEMDRKQALHTGTASTPVKIIDIGAEGGSMTLFGWKDEQGEWHFQKESNECALIGMLEEDGEDWGGATGIARIDSFTGWDKALTLLYRWPWPALYPRYVHPEFADRVMQEVKRAVK